MKSVESISLAFREGNSDKIYQAAIEQQEGGYTVTFAYGRRGSTLQAGKKTSQPVSFEEAKSIFDKLVREKTAKGYRSEDRLPSYAPIHIDGKEDTGIRCQLLNPIEEEQANMLVHTSGWCAQEKYDGRRMLLRRVQNNVIGINRKGFKIPVPAVYILTAMGIRAEFLLDGEAVGETYHAFDLLELDGQDLRPIPLRDRLKALENLLDGRDRGAIRLAPTARMRWEKEGMLAMLEGKKHEGIVFKHLDDPYVPGRPSADEGPWKFKFVETASCIVSGINAKRSVSLALLKEGEKVPAGNVTIPANHDVPFLGAIVDVRYLYAFPESGSLYQPIYLGTREDIEARECIVGQLKLKAAVAA